MIRYLFLFLAPLLLAELSACNKVENVNNEPNLIWSVSLSSDKLIQTSVYANVQYKGGLLLGGMEQDGRSLIFLNIEDGKWKWKWKDYLGDDSGGILEWPYLFENKLFIVDGRYQYCIDLDNGKTLWKKKTPNYWGNYASGISTNYLIPARFYENGDGTFQGKVVSGDIATGNESILAEIPFSKKYIDRNNSYGDPWGKCEYIKNNSVEGILVFYSDDLSPTELRIMLGLYDINKKTWMYNKPFVTNNNFGMRPATIINNTVINAVGKTLQCNNILTGEIVWTQNLSDLNSSEVGLADGKLIVTTQDRITHCIDPATGKELWALTTSGNPGIVRELNGIAYFVGGNAKLFAIDVTAGKILWQFSSPDEQINSKAFWQEGVRVVPGANGQKGKVIVSSYLNGYCYEAIR
jgi:outer membrane protein assembly factor BamB